MIWSPIVNTGLSDVIGSWKIIAICPPRSSVRRFLDIAKRSSPSNVAPPLAIRPGGMRDEAEKRHRRDALAGSRLADDPEHLARIELPADLGDGVNDSVLGLELDGEVVDGEDRLRHGLVAGGSSASRRPSPTKLTASAMTTITRPGNVTSHQAEKPETWPSAMSFPSAGVGGWTPKPRNESAASMRIAAAISSVIVTTIGPMLLGSMCRNMIRQIPRPGCLRRLDELLLAQREERAADDACEVRPEEERKDEPDRGTACPGRDTPRGRAGRRGTEHEKEVDEPHEQVVDLPAVVAGDCSHDGAQNSRHAGDEERHPERRAEPEDDAAQVVAPELVGPEQVPAAQRRLCRMTL